MVRTSRLLTALAVVALTLAPALAMARAGGGGSMGSRGMRTYSAPAITNTAPSSASPFQQSMTPRPTPGYNTPGYNTPGYGAPGYAPGYARGGFASGLLGGLLGAGIGGLLFGHGLFGGGGFGFIGFLLQLLILYFIARWLFRMFFHRPALAGGMAFPRMGQPSPGQFGGGSATRSAAPVTVSQADYHAFEQTLQAIQAAWSAQDMRRLQTLATPEMVSYFGEQLAGQASRGVRNSVTDVRLDQGDLSEAWAENGREYATVAMRFSMIDVTTDSTGRIVEGNPTQRSSATELWTFVRAPGGNWILSAIQQAR